MINIPIYKSIEIYNKCHEEKMDASFSERNSPFGKLLNAYSINKSEDVRFCLIDESFFEYVSTNGLEADKHSLALYINSLSNEEATKLWDNYDGNFSIELMSLPFLAIDMNIKERTYYSLKEEQKILLSNLIQELMQIESSDVFVPGYILTFKKMMDLSGSLFGVGESYLIDGKTIRYPIMEEQDNDTSCNIFLYCIPFFFKRKMKCIENTSFVEDFLTSPQESFENASIDPKDIIKIDGLETHCLVDNFVYEDDLEDVYKQVEDLVEKTKRKKAFFNFFKKH